MTRVTPRLYFLWLCGQIAVPQDNGRWDLLSKVHEKQFAWSVPNDGNRLADGVDLRKEFFSEMGAEVSDDSGASVLEVLVALSRRMSWVDDWPAANWAWKLFENLGLHHNRYLDPLYVDEINRVDDILDNLIWRRYEPTGLGGFFPLVSPVQDQTQVELWYQMEAYLEEQHPEHG